MNLAASCKKQPIATWPAALHLCLQGGSRGTRLSELTHSGPLYVQKPFYPEGRKYAHVYLLHPPGGMVSGDSLQVEVSAASNAHVLMTTPGATRAYRARDQFTLQRQRIRLRVEDNSSIEYFPMETIVHDGSRLKMQTRVEMQRNCVLTMWDIACFGLPASASPFLSGSLQQQFEIVSEGKPVFVDRLVVNSDNRLAATRCGLAGRSVTGFFLAGPFTRAHSKSYVEQARRRIDELDGGSLVALTTLNEFCVARYLGHSAAQARRYFTELWSLARPILLARGVSIPRIWYT